MHPLHCLHFSSDSGNFTNNTALSFCAQALTAAQSSVIHWGLPLSCECFIRLLCSSPVHHTQPDTLLPLSLPLTPLTCPSPSPAPPSVVSVNIFDYSGAILSYCLIGVPVFAGMYDSLDVAALSALISKVGDEMTEKVR